MTHEEWNKKREGLEKELKELMAETPVKKTGWHDTVSKDNPILCWVWDACNYSSVVRKAEEIFNYDESAAYPFEATTGDVWECAIPVKPEECYQAPEKEGNWRLPTRSELIDAFDKKVKGFNLDSGYWSSSPHADWSSSPHDSDTSEAWNVYLDNGYSYWDDKSDKKYVRCVRDTEDGLEWHEEADGFMNWDDAMKYAEELNG